MTNKLQIQVKIERVADQLEELIQEVDVIDPSFEESLLQFQVYSRKGVN